jgi:putative transposase
MQSFCETLVGLFDAQAARTHAWCVLPNHYHALIETTDAMIASGSSVSTLQRVSGPGQPEGWTPNQSAPQSSGILAVLAELGRMHGRLSLQWNGEEQTRGRQVWCGAAGRYMRNDGHFWATMNYVHHNPVHHGYVQSWQDWPYSSAQEYLAQMGKAVASRIWREYPVLEYGKGWDEADF